MTLWTVRHPPVDRGGRCVGQTHLRPTMEISQAVERVSATAPFRPKQIFSSDLPRCADLATGLAAVWEIPLALTPALREVHFGEWEGRHYDDLQREDNSRWTAWCNDWQRRAPPGGESLPDFTARIEHWLDANQPSPETLLVTHAGVIRALQVLSGDEWTTAMATDHPFLGWRRHSLTAFRSR